MIDAAQRGTEQAIAFTRDRNLVPYHDGVCLVGPAPESRRWAMAMISTNAPGEPEGPSWFYVTPPDPLWPRREQEEWLEVFSDTTLPGIVVHEVAPGHFSHGRALRRAPGPVRRTLPRPRSWKAGRITPRSCASRRGSAATIPASRWGCGWRPWSG